VGHPLVILTSSRAASARWHFRLLLWTLAITGAASEASIARAKVLVASTTLGTSSAIYEFDDAGNLLGTLDVTPGGSVLFSLATDGTRILAGHAFHGFRDYSLDGTFRGQIAGLETPQEGPIAELDARGNIYLLDSGAPRRLNPDGTLSMTFPQAEFEYGIDADAAGNVYIMQAPRIGRRGIHRYSPEGALREITSFGGLDGHLAIDEVGQTLYATASRDLGETVVSEILAFDISGSAPTFTRRITGPQYLSGISFDPTTGHLFAASLLGGYAWEITTDGAVVRRYSIPGTNPFDVVAIRVPEASTSTMFVAMVMAGVRYHVVRSWRAPQFSRNRRQSAS